MHQNQRDLLEFEPCAGLSRLTSGRHGAGLGGSGASLGKLLRLRAGDEHAQGYDRHSPTSAIVISWLSGSEPCSCHATPAAPLPSPSQLSARFAEDLLAALADQEAPQS